MTHLQEPTPSPRFEMVAKTFFGLEEVLANELRQFGATKIEVGGRAVSFMGDKQVMYRANFCSRVALRILIPIKTFTVLDEEELYQEVRKIDWENYMSIEDTLSIDGVVNSSNLTHSKYVALKTKDAIIDQFRDKYNDRPSIDVKNPTLRINVRVSKNICTLSLDSSGDILYKRGYRSVVSIAPINEVLAAGMIMLSGWDKKSPFIDPMCGSGTFLIEAALLAKNIPAGYLRKEFGFEKWKKFLAFEQRLWNAVKDDAFRKKTNRLNTTIVGSDISEEAIQMTRENLRNAKLSHEIEVEQIAFDQQIPPTGEGVMITNPPYGERLNEDDVTALYKQIGDRLKSKYAGYSAWLITSNADAAKHIGLHPTKKIIIFNGALECRFLKFEIYKGSRKVRKPEDISKDELLI